MKIITNKKKDEIGQRLAAILYIAIHGYGKGMKNDLDATSKIINHVYDIADMVGGLSFANYEIPKWFDQFKRYADDKHKGEENG